MRWASIERSNRFCRNISPQSAPSKCEHFLRPMAIRCPEDLTTRCKCRNSVGVCEMCVSHCYDKYFSSNFGSRTCWCTRAQGTSLIINKFNYQRLKTPWTLRNTDCEENGPTRPTDRFTVHLMLVMLDIEKLNFR